MANLFSIIKSVASKVAVVSFVVTLSASSVSYVSTSSKLILESAAPSKPTPSTEEVVTPCEVLQTLSEASTEVSLISLVALVAAALVIVTVKPGAATGECISTLVDTNGYVNRMQVTTQDNGYLEVVREFKWINEDGENIVGCYIPAWPITNPFKGLEGEVAYTAMYERGTWEFKAGCTEIRIEISHEGMRVCESNSSEYTIAIPLAKDGIHLSNVDVPKTLGYTIPEALCLGIEIEFSTPSTSDAVAVLANIGNKALFKVDNSCGVELVSVPLLPSEMLEFIDNLTISELGISSSCGVHIHLSRKYLTQSQIGGLVVFMNHPDNLSYIAGIAGREPNKYCKQVVGKSDTLSDNRYEMVNLTNSATVEVRIFAGTNDTHVLAGYVQWLLDLLKWLETNPTSYLASEFIAYTNNN